MKLVILRRYIRHNLGQPFALGANPPFGPAQRLEQLRVERYRGGPSRPEV
jgi:hypothetical protein